MYMIEIKTKMSYLEEDESMPAFISDIKAYSSIQFEYHSQHSAAIRELEAQNHLLTQRINELEIKLNLIIKGSKQSKINK